MININKKDGMFMQLKIYDKLTIDNNEYIVAYVLKYEGKVYYYLTNQDVETDLKFVFVEENEFYEVEDDNLIFNLFAVIAKENI
ncbi:MAG: hypothetical protein IJD92_01530 [Bacilli bacterium]|nr:hypothetical protein [Bacilli bacterium]